MKEKEYIVKIEDLSVEYRTEDSAIKAVNHIDLKLEKGKTLGLVGETGAGKTTTALSILRLISSPPGYMKSGVIKLNGENILEYSKTQMEDIRGSIVSMIFQDPMTSLDPVLPVGNQIAEVYLTHENISKKDAWEKAGIMLETVGIPANRAKEYPHQFSGGMKQRVVIAMALACQPQLLIADEPTTALDVTIQAQVLLLMKKLKAQYQMSMIMITHDLGIVAEVCDEVSVIYAGQVVEHGSLEDIFNNTAHPYTKGLFHSLPNIKNRTEKLTPIKGLMPDPANLPTGCPFYPRCSEVMESCSCREPKKTHISDTHYVQCIRFEEKEG
ncbi:MAG: ABC transporter ATP-binding protein [Clostridium sp.]